MRVEQLSPLRLVGGTALALQLGHRNSVDIDLFGALELEDIMITKALSPFSNARRLGGSKSIKVFLVNNVKVDSARSKPDERLLTSTMYQSTFKRWIDFLLAFIGFAMLFPVFLLCVIGLAIANQGQPFFFQTRPGRNGRLFRIIKFKTMNDKKDAAGNLLPDAQRLTTWGRFVRSTSLDEIPQLLNVIKGDMSLIGPRPLLEQYLPLYSPEQARRHDVRPGITGWAQINGRNAISWEKKFELDVYYVDHCCFSLDVKILLLTIKKVFKSEGISQEGQATVEPFRGSGK